MRAEVTIYRDTGQKIVYKSGNVRYPLEWSASIGGGAREQEIILNGFRLTFNIQQVDKEDEK